MFFFLCSFSALLATRGTVVFLIRIPACDRLQFFFPLSVGRETRFSFFPWFPPFCGNVRNNSLARITYFPPDESVLVHVPPPQIKPHDVLDRNSLSISSTHPIPSVRQQPSHSTKTPAFHRPSPESSCWRTTSRHSISRPYSPPHLHFKFVSPPAQPSKMMCGSVPPPRVLYNVLQTAL